MSTSILRQSVNREDYERFHDAVEYIPETVKDEIPKTETFKDEIINFKVIEVENPKPEGVEVEKPKPEGVEVENPKPEGIEVEDPKPEDVEVENPKPEGVEVEDPKPEDVEVENPKPEGVEVEDPKPEGIDVENPNPEGVEVENQKSKGKFKFKTIARGLGFLKRKDSEDEKLIRLYIPEHFRHQEIWGEYHSYEGARLVLDTLKYELSSEINSINLDKKPIHLSISDFIEKVCGDLNKFIESISECKKQKLIETFLYTTIKIKLSPETFRKMIIEKILENNVDIFLDKKKEIFFKSANSFKIVDGKKVPELLWDQERLKYKEQKWSELEKNYRLSSITKIEFNRIFNTEMEEEDRYIINKKNEFKILEEITQDDLREEEKRILEKDRFEREEREKINQINSEYQRKINEISQNFKLIKSKLHEKRIEESKIYNNYQIEISETQMKIINLENQIKELNIALTKKESKYETDMKIIKEEKKSIYSEKEETDKQIDNFIDNHGYNLGTEVELYGLNKKDLNGIVGTVISDAYVDHNGKLRQEVEYFIKFFEYVRNDAGIIISSKQRMRKVSSKFKVENLMVPESFMIEFKNNFKK